MGYRPQAAPLILFTATLLIALSVGEPTRAAGPERPFKAYAPLMARDDPAAAPSGTGTPVATAVGVSSGTATSATIGAAGGVLTTPDSKLVLAIPAGALASATVISVQPITNNAPGSVGTAYRLTPDGQTFLKPITLSFGYTDADLVGTAADFLGAAFQTADGYWQWVGDATVDATAKTASVSISHFTDVSLTAGLQIFPARKVVKTNGSVSLQVKVCYDPDLSTLGPGGASLGFDCDDSRQGIVGTLAIDQWSVNGRLGGGDVFGRVSGTGATATYTAPSTKPIPNPVAVSARVHNPRRRASATTLVSSVITIAEDSWTGTSTFASATYDTHADLTWTLESTEANVAYYEATGTATIVPKKCQWDPLDGIVKPNDGQLWIDYNADPPTYRGGGAAFWGVTVTCPGGLVAPLHTIVNAPFFGIGGGGESVGVVSVDGSTLEGFEARNGLSIRWRFTRDR